MLVRFALAQRLHVMEENVAQNIFLGLSLMSVFTCLLNFIPSMYTTKSISFVFQNRACVETRDIILVRIDCHKRQVKDRRLYVKFATS